jgi:hypothetical protein
MGTGSASEIFDLFGTLKEAELSLGDASAGLEKQFLATGSELETLKGSGDRFVEEVEKLVGVATGKDCDKSIFDSSIQLIEQAAGFLSVCQTETDHMLEALQRYDLHIGELLGAEVELHRAMLPLKCVQTLFKVESAPLGPAFQQMFTALTQEMEALHGQVRDLFGTKFKQLEKTRATLRYVTRQLEAQSKSLREVMISYRRQIDSSLDTLRKELASNQQRDISLRRLSQKLCRDVEKIVVGLQFQDIVNQKLQHVSAALPKIQSAFAEVQALEAGETHKPYQAVRQACLLEEGQLELVQRELSGAEHAIRDGIQRVLASMQDMDSQCISLNEFEKLTTSCDGTVQTLLEIIDEVRGLVGSTVSRASEVYAALQPMGCLTSDLTANVRTMSARIHLIGLNAQIQAAQANEDGAGGGIEVLSARTSEISHETSRISEQAAAQLDDLASGLARIVKSFAQLQSDGLNQHSLMEQKGRTEENRLHALRDQALSILRNIGQSLDDIKLQATDCLAHVNFEEFHQVLIPRLRAPLAEIARTAESWLTARRQPVDPAVAVSNLAQNYCMESERQVFARIVAHENGGEKTVPALPAALLADDAPASPLLSDAPRPAEALGDNVELF